MIRAWLTTISFQETLEREDVSPKRVANALGDVLAREHPASLEVDGKSVVVQGPFKVFWIHPRSVASIRSAEFDIARRGHGICVTSRLKTRMPLFAVLFSIAIVGVASVGAVNRSRSVLLIWLLMCLISPGITAVWSRRLVKVSARRAVQKALVEAIDGG